MLRYVDHVILGVDDLDAAARDYGATLGFAVSAGGVHPGMGTRNRLIVLDPTYVELIARVPGVEVSPLSPVGAMLNRGPGPIGFALASDDIERDVEAMRGRGLSVDGPVEGRLEWSPGQGRGWRTARLVGSDAWRLPFIIQHDAEGRERLKKIAAPDPLKAHPSGVMSVPRVVVAVHDLQAGLHVYERIFDLSHDEESDDVMLEARTARLPLAIGAIVLAAPRVEGLGPIARGLAMQGEGLFSVSLAVDDLPRAVNLWRGGGIGVRVHEPRGWLEAAYPDPARLHGARLELVPARTDSEERQ